MIVEDLRGARRDAGISQEEVALAVGVSVPTIQSWETGRRSPGLAALRRWVAYFNLELVVTREKCPQCGRPR